MAYKSLQQEFQDKYLPEVTTGCWLWVGAKDGHGYGRFQVDGKGCGAHRVSYELFKGKIPKGMFVCHTCDVPGCVRPDHLWLGTDADNNADKIKKGRQSKGENHWKAKLSESQVLEIRAAGGLHREIAVRYGVSQSHVCSIKARKKWAHL